MILLQATAQGNQNFSMIFMVLMIVVFYFLFLRPNQKKQKAVSTFRNNLLVGDMVLTNGGLKGKVVEIINEWVVLELGKDVHVTILKDCLNPLPSDNKEKK